MHQVEVAADETGESYTYSLPIAHIYRLKQIMINIFLEHISITAVGKRVQVDMRTVYTV